MCRRVGVSQPLPAANVLLRGTFKVALPSITESFLVALVGMVDTFMVSGLGDYAISAVGLTTQPKFIALLPFIALNVALSALVARRRGEGKLDEAVKILRTALVLSVVLCVVISILAVVFAPLILRLVGSQEDTHTAAVQYFRIIVAGMIFNVITMAVNAAQRGAGNTKIAMKTNIVANLVNVVFNFLLIEGRFGFPRLETAGAAIATVIGTVVACGMALASVWRRDAPLNLPRAFVEKLKWAEGASLLRLASPILMEQLCVRFGFVMFVSLVARLGTTANAAHHIGMNFMSLSFSVGDGLSVAAVALVGKSLGEKRKDLALIYSSLCQRIGILFSVCFGIIYIPFGRLLFSMFSGSQSVQGYGVQLMTVITVIVFIQITMIIFMSCLRAAGDVKYVAAISLVSIGIVRPGAAWLLCYPLGLGLIGAWIGTLADQSLRLLLSYLRYRSGRWLNIKI